MPAPRLLAALRTRPFALLWAGQTVSRFGDAVSTIAVAWLVLQLTGSAAAMGIVLAANVLAFLAFGLIGGVVVDRVPRLAVMLTADAIRLVLTAGVALLIANGRIELPLVVAFSAAYGAITAFFYPAYGAVIPELVPTDDRPSANSLYQLSRRLANLIGPGIGATLVATGGTATAFGLDAVSFGVSAALVAVAMASRSGAAARAGSIGAGAGVVAGPSTEPSIGPDLDRGAIPGRASAWADLREGIRAVTSEPWLWIAILLAGVTGITLAGPIEAGLPLLVRHHLGAGVEVLGLVQSAVALGAIGAALVLGSRARVRRRGLALYAAWIAFAAGVAVVGLPIGIAATVVAAALIGACGATVGLIWTNTVQDLVRPELLGRVNAIDAIGSSALEPVGFVVAGAAADTFGAGPTFLVGGVVSAGILSLALLSTSVRRLD